MFRFIVGIQESNGFGEETITKSCCEDPNALVLYLFFAGGYRVCEGCVSSSTMLLAFQMQRVW